MIGLNESAFTVSLVIVGLIFWFGKNKVMEWASLFKKSKEDAKEVVDTAIDK